MTIESTVRSAYDHTFGGDHNMSTMERAGSVAVGLAIAAGSLARPDIRGVAMLLAGAALVARGMTGHCPVKAMLADGGHGHAGSIAGHRTDSGHRMDEDAVDRARAPSPAPMH